MVILKPSPQVSDEFECEIVDIQQEDKSKYSLVRPCERYEELYKSCRSFRSRFGQYYVHGEFFDCSDHLQNYKSCLEYRRTKNFEVLASIIKWEKNLIETRVNTVLQNKVWELRETPPDFETPLPEFIANRQRGSLFKSADRSGN